jgi:hypothetical protein
MHKTKRTNKYSKKTQTKKLQTKKPQREKLQTKKPKLGKTRKSYDCKKGITDEAKRYLKYIRFFKNKKQVSLSNDQ